MTGEIQSSVGKNRRWLKALIGTLALFVAAAWYLTSPRFNERMRQRVVERLDQITGGRTELKSFHWNLWRLEFQGDDLTIHGRETAGEIPYAHAVRVLVRLKILSVIRRQIGFRQVAIEHPVIHLIIRPDQSTNQPLPNAPVNPAKPAAIDIFDIAINRLEIRDGMLLVNESPTPFNFTAGDLHATMRYAELEARYDGTINFGTVNMTYGDFPPLRSHTEIQFSLFHNKAEIRSLRWWSDQSRIQASGLITNYGDPTVAAIYNASLDLGEVGDMAGIPELRAGRVEVNGHGSCAGRDFSTSGKLSLTHGEYRDRSRQVSGIDAAANYSVTRERLVITGLRGRAFGGVIAGSADVLNWSHPQPSGPRTEPRRVTAGKRVPTEALQKGAFHLGLDGLQLSSLTKALAVPSLHRLHPVGSGIGTVDAAWTGNPYHAAVMIAFEVTPPEGAAVDELPMAATIQAEYIGGQRKLRVKQCTIATRSTRLSAEGALGSSSSSLGISLNSTNLVELQRTLEILGQPRIPAELHGGASFSGIAVGTLNNPWIAGHLQASNFDYLFLPSELRRELLPQAHFEPPLPSQLKPRRAHWESLSVDLNFSRDSLKLQHGMLRRGQAWVGFESAAKLTQGSFLASNPFSAKFDVRSTDLADLEALTGYDIPLSGTASLLLNVSGTRANPLAGGNLEVKNGSIYDEPFQSLRAVVRLAGTELQLSNLVLIHNGASVEGNVTYNVETRGFGFDVVGRKFELGKFRQLQSEKLAISGAADFHAQGSGTPHAPAINADLHIRHMVLNGEEAGDFDATAVTRGADMQLMAHSHFQNTDLGLDGSIHLRDEFPASIILQFEQLDIDPLLRAYLGGRLTGHSHTRGTIELRGPLLRPRDLDITGHVDQFSAEVEKIRLESDGPVQFTLNNETLRVDRVRLVGPGTDIVAGGTIALGDRQDLNIHADGRMALGLLRTLNHDLSADGVTEVNVHVGGTVSGPKVLGQVRVENGSISYIELPNGLSEITGTLVFNQNRLQVQSLTARTGGGLLNLGGFIAYSHGLNFNLSVTSKDIRLRYPPGLSAIGDADLRFVGSAETSRLSGDITITKFAVGDFDFALFLARSRQLPTTTDLSSPLNNIHLDMHIVSTPELQVQTSQAKLVGNADLRVRGTAARPIVLGRIDIAQGNITFNGTKYRLERGDIQFTNPTRTVPILNIEAAARVRDYDITLGFHGTLDKLGVSYRSDPPLSSSDIVALLALGRTREDTALTQQPNQIFTESASNAILGQALTATENNRMQRLFGISGIKIDPQAAGPSSNPEARATIEQQVSDKVTLTYITNLAQSTQQIIQVEYQVNRRVSVIAIRDQTGVVALDVRYRQRKR